ncbi:hypothetical protein LZ32DRAFT_431475 [Colletotrichum eremochloae]|nr:hypothetical protein LZ32DRAFT_431475 [Colletotrichum eremochloae]
MFQNVHLLLPASVSQPVRKHIYGEPVTASLMGGYLLFLPLGLTSRSSTMKATCLLRASMSPLEAEDVRQSFGPGIVSPATPRPVNGSGFPAPGSTSWSQTLKQLADLSLYRWRDSSCPRSFSQLMTGATGAAEAAMSQGVLRQLESPGLQAVIVLYDSLPGAMRTTGSYCLRSCMKHTR